MAYDLRVRTLKFSVELVKFLNLLSYSTVSSVVVNQVVRSGTSIGANLEEADSSPTRKDLKYKMIVSKKEAAETIYWLRILIDSKLMSNESNIAKASQLLDECDQILRILGSITRKL